MTSAKKKPLPSFKTDQEAEDFVATADLSEYDLSGGVPVHYEFRNKNANNADAAEPALGCQSESG